MSSSPASPVDAAKKKTPEWDAKDGWDASDDGRAIDRRNRDDVRSLARTLVMNECLWGESAAHSPTGPDARGVWCVIAS